MFPIRARPLFLPAGVLMVAGTDARPGGQMDAEEHTHATPIYQHGGNPSRRLESASGARAVRYRPEPLANAQVEAQGLSRRKSWSLFALRRSGRKSWLTPLTGATRRIELNLALSGTAPMLLKVFPF
jgi:hypothetical protein